MSSLIQFLSDLRALGISLSLKGDGLSCNAPKNAVTPEIRAQLADRKADIMAFLRDTQPWSAPGKTESSSGELPLSRSQRRVWFLGQRDPRNPAHNIGIPLWLTGALDSDALGRSLYNMVERHEALRTGFFERSGQPFARIVDATGWKMALVDLTHLGAQEAEAEARRVAFSEARWPFDLEQPPLFRATLIRLTPERYLLVMAVQHIVADGWSLGILSRELMELYGAFVRKQPSPLEKPAYQFRDFVRWEQEVGEKTADQEMSYWLERLGGELPILELPGDRRRPLTQTFIGKQLAVKIEGSLGERIRELSRETGTTVFMVLVAAFQSLLFRYTGLEDILVGSNTSNRSKQEFSTQIGFFVNNVVLRTDLSGHPSFAELLRRVQDTAVGAYAHQNVPFDRLVESLRLERGVSHSPLVQVMFTLQNVPLPELRLPELAVEVAQIDPGIARADFGAMVWAEDKGFRCDFEYNTDLFDERTVRQMATHYVRFLEGAVSNPSLAIGEVLLLSEPEREQVLVTWNQTASAYPHVPVHSVFAEQVRLTPDAVALCAADAQVSYRELDAMANAVAYRLVAAGVRPRSFVAVCAASSPARIAALLGVLKAGAAYLPLDPDSPLEHLAHMIEDAGTSVLLASRALAGRLSGLGAAQIILLEEIVADGKDSAPPVSVEAGDPAYLMYTSGSTGKPKGVVVPHRGIVRLVRDTDYAQFSADEVFLELAPVSFDASTFEIWGALLNGARLVLLPESQRGPEGIQLAIRAQGVTTLWLTAALFHLMAGEHIEALAPLRQLLAGGDVLSTTHVRRVLEYAPHLRLINGYGPTENTTFTCCHTITLDSLAGGSVPIGRPIRNTRVYLLDEYQQPAPIGVSGELYAAGDGLALGYLHAPELTAEKFVTLNLGQAQPERLYRTGDIARYRPDGTIEFIGRRDKQIKLRGYRIELSEVEEALLASSGVRAAVASVRRWSDGDQRLIAYVVAEEGKPLNTQQLRRSLKSRLPMQLVPNNFFIIPQVPATANGKVDFAALDALPLDMAQQEAAPSRPPANDTEARLAAIFSELLKLKSVSMEEDFFALGGHSLLAMQLASRIEREFQVKIPVTVIFQSPAVETLAKVIAAKQDGAATSSALSMPRSVLEQREHPLSRSQQRLWFLDQLDPGNAVYNMVMPVRLTGVLPFRAMERSLKAILERHESLRTSFHERNGMPYAKVESADDWTMHFQDFSGHAPEIREDEMLHYGQQEARRPFALDRGPLLRAVLLRAAPEEHVLILVVHHIVFDGWSMGVLAQELIAIYEAFSAGREPALAPVRHQFRDFVAWEQRQSGDAGNGPLLYWKKQLGGELPLLELPTDYRRPPIQSFRGERIWGVISAELADRLQRLSRQQNATLFMVLFAAYNVLLMHYSRQDDILVGTPTAGRLRSEFEGMIGFFVNNLVLRTDLTGNPSFTELVGRVQNTALEAFEHQSVPFDQLVEELQPDRGLDRSPIFQVLFTLQNTPQPKAVFSGLETTVVEFQGAHARYDLAVDVFPFEGVYICNFEYNTDLFDEATMRQMQQHYVRLLEAVVADPTQKISALPLLSGEEFKLLTEDWNRTGTAHGQYETVPDWFSSQAASTPDATAVLMGDRILTYAELDRQSTALAGVLRSKGVRREVVVGLYVTRGFNMVVGLLAILKAGGAYLPLDPAFPAQRIEFLLSDAGAPLILTETAIQDTLPETAASLLCLDQPLPAMGAAAIDQEPHAEDLAYLIYTSGSTGNPKGTELTHGALVNLLSSMLREPGLSQEDTLVAVTTLSFDIAGLEIFGPLVCGARLALASREQAVDPLALAELVERVDGTVLQATPSTWRMLVESGWLGKSGLRMWCGGEALPPELADSLLERGRELWNLYGPTETTIWSAAHRVSSGENPILIGRPIANTRMYILDAHGRPAPIGVAGELYIAGDGVARGYWKRPDLTESRFVPEPFSAQANSRMYRTGDLARYRRDGQIQLLGRADQQIKLRGHRIELGEIEAVLEHHPEVQQAVVALYGEGSGQQLVAYVKQAEKTDPSHLRMWLQERIPDYMTPSIFLSLRELPLTPNGKVDRKRLPPPEETVRERSTAAVGPRNRMERVLVEIWSDVLRVDLVGIHDNFFDLGGHSLLLIKIHARLRQQVDADLAVVDLFRYPTIEALAECLERRQQAAAIAEGAIS